MIGCQYEYFIKDHLGNTRVTFSAIADGIAQVVQEEHYYPFGMEMPGACYQSDPAGNIKYLYNGKEYHNDFGLNLYFYGMRWYDPVVCRFVSVDPLSDNYPHNSVYAFAENDVIRAVDLDGLEKFVVITMENEKGTNSAGVHLNNWSDGKIQHIPVQIGWNNATNYIVSKLNEAVGNDPYGIAFLAIIPPHGIRNKLNPHYLIFGNKNLDGSYIRTGDLNKFNQVKFTHDALVFISACNSAREYPNLYIKDGKNMYKDEIFAQNLSKIKGIKVIGTDGLSYGDYDFGKRDIKYKTDPGYFWKEFSNGTLSNTFQQELYLMDLFYQQIANTRHNDIVEPLTQRPIQQLKY